MSEIYGLVAIQLKATAALQLQMAAALTGKGQDELRQRHDEGRPRHRGTYGQGECGMTPRNPMPSAWREHVNGPVKPMGWEPVGTVIRIGGKPSLFLFACGIVATFAIAAIGA